VDGLDQTRFISATTETANGRLQVIGVCIPWHMAEVTYPIDVKRKPWELHIRYLELLDELIADIDTPTIVAGDFNQTVPRIQYGNRAAAEAMAVTFSTLDVVTNGQIEGCTRPGIDHVAVSRDLTPAKVWGWPNQIDGRRLSDHEGAGADLGVTDSGVR
jgi:endonuclease/exonuclease/phosphatase family metal-dependent hydrolase